MRSLNRSATARDVRRVNESDMEEGINISQGSIRDQESSVIDMGTLEQLGLVERLVWSPDQVFGLCKSPVDVKGYVDVEIQIANGASVVVTRLKV